MDNVRVICGEGLESDCFFHSPVAAVAAGGYYLAIIPELSDFNKIMI